jgi:Zn-dependent oligopeptidase
MSNGWKSELVAIFYADFPSKRKTNGLDDFYKSQFKKTKSMKDRTFQTYVISETYRNKTFLIDFNEVTLFHEFGHGLHTVC